MPKQGDFGLVKMPGSTGALITLGEWLNGDGFGKYDHAFVYVDSAPGGTNIVEAEPGGARLADYTEYDDITWSSWNLTDAQRADIVFNALKLLGTKYSVLDYFALAMKRLHLPFFGWVKKRVESTKYVICSQLVDEAYGESGLYLFNDHRWYGDVTPMDLGKVLAGPA